MTRNAVTNVQAAIILVGALGAWVFVPHNVLLPVTLAVLASTMAGVFAARAYLRRLNEVVVFLEANRHSFEASTLPTLLTSPERRFLRLGCPVDAGHAIGVLRDRLSMVTHAGMLLGLLAIGSGLIAIIAYSD